MSGWPVARRRRAGFGKIADRAIDGSAAAKRNLARLQKPPPWYFSVLVHHLDLRLSREFSTLEVTIPLPFIPNPIQRRVVGRHEAVPSAYRAWPSVCARRPSIG